MHQQKQKLETSATNIQRIYRGWYTRSVVNLEKNVNNLETLLFSSFFFLFFFVSNFRFSHKWVDRIVEKNT